MAMIEAMLEIVLRRDRAIVAAALAALTALAWTYVLWLAADMNMGGKEMTGFRMVPAGMGIMAPATAPWQAIEFVYAFTMWAVMMVGMMTPSAAPMILIYARVGRQASAQGKPFAAAGWFATGYLLTWAGFALAATAAQWALDRMALLDPMMASGSQVFGGIVDDMNARKLLLQVAGEMLVNLHRHEKRRRRNLLFDRPGKRAGPGTDLDHHFCLAQPHAFDHSLGEPG